MIKKQFLVVLITLCSSFMGFGQIITFDFAGLVGNEASSNSNFNNANLTTSTITRGSGLTTSNNADRFNATNWALTSISNAVSGNNYMEFTITPNANYQFSVNSITINLQRSDTGPSAVALRSSVDGYSSNLDAIKPIVDNTSTQTFTFTFTQANTISSVTYRFYMYAEATGGSGGIGDGLGNDLIVNGSVSSIEDVDWCNLQFPPSTSIVDGTAYNVYAQVEEAGYVNGSGGPYPLISAWIGHSLVDSDPTNPVNSGDWTWELASFNVDVSATRAEYVFDLASVLQTGTYYYCSRFQYNGGPYKYGGYNGGFWQAGVNFNQELTITPDQVNFCNVQYPKSFGITTGSYFEVYAQVNEPGVTDSPGEGAQIDAWIGYNTIGINHQPWDPTGWTWIEATYNPSCLDCNSGANDEYFAEIGCGLPVGTYYYASRFQLNGSDYSYGGIQSDGVGNFWDATNNSGTLTITDPPLAEVVITEIMYNTGGTDDEWIEICNFSGSTQDISNYSIDISGSGTAYTFPCNTTIADGTCITVSLGSNGDGTYNNGNGTPATGYCPFTPDFGLGASTNDTDNLANSSRTITLYSADGTTEVDLVTYNSTDGANGNGSSLHVTDESQDNSDTGTNWQEVAYGGSSSVNSLIPNCVPMVVEINVEGNLGAFPDIPDDNTNSNTPVGTNNTLFAAQLIGDSQSKTYRIQNLGSLDLTISLVTINGANPGDFSVTLNPVSPIVYGSPTILEITFSPILPGVRNAIVTINNNDSDENPYTFNVRGTGLCVASSNTISPSSGPVGTIVTVTGANLSSASATLNGISASVNHISSTQMEVIVPNGATTGNLEIVNDLTCTSVIPFTVIDNQISSCEGGSALTEIFISEVTDATYGGLTYIELYNPTSANIDLSNYSIDIYINGNTDPLDTGKYKTQALTGTILAGQTFVISAGYSGSFNCDSEPGGDASYNNFNSTTLGGINKEADKHDYIALLNLGSVVDEFGVFGDTDWMDTLHTTVSGDRGFDFRRKNTASSFSDPFDDYDWDIIDWVGTGSGSCSTNDYSDIGFFDFSTGTPPLVNSGPTISSSCNMATISVTGSEGYSGGNPLVYQWYSSAPGDPGWAALINDSTYNDVTSSTLNILDTSSLEGYQYYCQILEDGSSCYSASDAVQLTLPATTWNGSTWSNGTPTLGTLATINGNYNTTANGSFSACRLIVNASFNLTVNDGDYVEVENDVTVNGQLFVRTQGNFVQNNDSASFTDNTVNGVVVSKSKLMQKWYSYTYWSSPVVDETIEGVLGNTPINRRFKFEAANFIDTQTEIGNTNLFTPGPDGLDDDGNDWQPATGAMIPGIGYAATASEFGPAFPRTEDFDFYGEFNNGIITSALINNSGGAYNDWNFIGNPYPGAISADEFFNVNSTLVDVIYLWDQATPPSSTTSGSQNLNFSADDFAMINGIGEIGARGDTGLPPNRFVPSGQGFFVEALNAGNVIFKNSMRSIIADNSQFFRKSNSKVKSSIFNKLWVNLSSDNGIFNQIMIGYVKNASNKNDGSFFDTKRVLTPNRRVALYSIIEDDNGKFAIQGKDPNSLNDGEVIPLGFYTAITEATLYKLSIAQLEGDFLTSNPIYLKDNLLNKVHDLTASDYSFTSDVGEFKDRFEIVFQYESLSDVEAKMNLNKLTIIELNDGRVQLKTNSIHTIKSVQILDLLGRTLYQLKGTSSTEIYNLNNLSQSAYIAKVELSNGQIITKKTIKRN